jgi:hypothetical protein
MKKTAKKTTAKKSVKEVVIKKERTPEQKAARKLRRAQRRANVKSMAPVKESLETSKSIFKPEISQWAPIPTSDGLPFSRSVDNPDSLLGQLARMERNAEITKAQKDAEALKAFRTPKYAGHSGHAITATSFE